MTGDEFAQAACDAIAKTTSHSQAMNAINALVDGQLGHACPSWHTSPPVPPAHELPVYPDPPPPGEDPE